jgi:D-alanine-D-alanine ligase
MRVGILYNLVDEVERGKELDKLADNEVLETSQAVKLALEKKGYTAVLERLKASELRKLKQKYDLIFNLAEGIGSDPLKEPLIAKGFEKANLPFTGAGSKALKLCLNKEKAKKELIKNNIPTPKYMIIKKLPAKKKKKLAYPLIIKPVHEDGSIGINSDSVVYDDISFEKKVKEILEVYKQPALVEEYIDGREINVALLGNGNELQALPLSEIIFDFPENIPKIVSFEAKWVEESMLCKKSVGRCPAEVTEKIRNEMVEVAKKAYNAMGCSDYGRVDIRLRGEEYFVLEVNPNPCINPNGAGYIRSANTAGYSYDDVINKIVEIAMKRYSVQ